jgi:anti-sigma regulatory factor (Ser/Thr protein kinase)
MTPQVMWIHETRLSPGPRSASRARHFVGSHLERHRLPYLVDDVKLVVSELVTNALVHARTPIRVRLEEFLFCVRLTVHDDSPARPVVRVADTTDTGGRGLSIVDQCSVQWGTNIDADGGKSVWALFAVKPLPFDPATANRR